jgi:hypothetical protein
MPRAGRVYGSRLTTLPLDFPLARMATRVPRGPCQSAMLLLAWRLIGRSRMQSNVPELDLQLAHAG